MTVPSNTYQTYTQTNIREDLSNLIFNVDPFKTPILNMTKKNKATQRNHEWDTDSLAAQNLSNAQVEGDENLRVRPIRIEDRQDMGDGAVAMRIELVEAAYGEGR